MSEFNIENTDMPLNLCDLDALELLKYGLKCGKIEGEVFAQIQAEFEMKKRQQLLKKHPYAITKSKDGYWRSYLKTETGRKQIKRKNREDLENIILESMKVITVRDVFKDCLERKVKNDGIKESTVVRYESVFRRHFINTGWSEKDVRSIKVGDFIDFCEDEIGKGLDAKATSNFRGVVKSIIRRARNRNLINYTSSEVLDCIETRPVKKKRDQDKQRFSKEEVEQFIRYCMNKPTVTHLSLLFMLLSGLRVGEMVSLEYSDFLNETTFKISKTETFYRKDGKWIYEISNAPKTEAGERITSIPSSYSWIVKELKRMRPGARYLCTNERGERMTSQSLRARLYRICDELGFADRKSCHKLRKTFASILISEGFSTEMIKEILGHRDIQTTSRFYNFDRGTTTEKQKVLDNIYEFKRVSNG